MEEKDAMNVRENDDETKEVEEASSSDLDREPQELKEDVVTEQAQDDTNEQITALQKEVADLEKELEEMKNRYLRAQADLENFRRRTRKEKEEQAKYAALPVVQALLPVLDNLERALAASKESGANDGLIKGVEMVDKQIRDVLAEEGLTPIQGKGEPFNPEYHDAVMQVESEDVDSGIVVEELQRGYMLKDRVIRPSMVKVSK